MGYNNNNVLKNLEERFPSLTADATKQKTLESKISNLSRNDVDSTDSQDSGVCINSGYNASSKIFSFKKDAPSFLITGCQGASYIVGDQSGVAKAMRKFHLENPSNDRAGILLGDNFYNSGVKHEKDPLFEKHFYQMYQGLDFPFFNILGNHDYDFHGRSSKAIHPMQRGMAQVNHTYSAKANLGFPDWVMPARYYALSYNNANFFMLDSSTFCFDAEQRYWLETTHKALNPTASKKWNILVMHHPLVSYGKRHPETKKSDIDFYWLNEYEQLNYSYLSLPESTMNQWVFKKLAELNLEFDLQLCAHDHFLGLSKIEKKPYTDLKNRYWTTPPVEMEEPMYQALVGGGGAFPTGLERKDLAIWTEENFGFLNLKIGKNNIDLNFHHFGRFWGGVSQKTFNIGRDPLLKPNEDDPSRLYLAS